MSWDDGGTEAEALSDWEDEDWDDDEPSNWGPSVRRQSNYAGGDKAQPNRWRCLATGCNPVLDEASAVAHNAESGHRVARWPVRSAEGKQRARERNQNGYYDRYNVGAKSPEVRGVR